MKYETKITVNKDACLTEKRLREQILISDPLSFCPAAGMVISISFSDIMNRFNIEINCVNSDIAESAIAHNDWLQVKKKNQFYLTQIILLEYYYCLQNQNLKIA